MDYRGNNMAGMRREDLSDYDDEKERREIRIEMNRRVRQKRVFKSLSYDLSKSELKDNHNELPLYVGNLVQDYFKEEAKRSQNSSAYEFIVELYLETFNPKFKEGYEFVVLIAEPRSRQEFIQSFKINQASLYASVTLGYDSDKIIHLLNQFNKFKEIPAEIKRFIEETTSSFGKCRLVLQDNSYFLESDFEHILEYYRGINALSDCWNGPIMKIEDSFFNEKETVITETKIRTTENQLSQSDTKNIVRNIEEQMRKNEIDDSDSKEVYRLMIKRGMIDKVRIERDGNTKYKYMLSQEYIYKNNKGKAKLIDINLKSNVR